MKKTHTLPPTLILLATLTVISQQYALEGTWRLMNHRDIKLDPSVQVEFDFAKSIGPNATIQRTLVVHACYDLNYSYQLRESSILLNFQGILGIPRKCVGNQISTIRSKIDTVFYFTIDGTTLSLFDPTGFAPFVFGNADVSAGPAINGGWQTLTVNQNSQYQNIYMNGSHAFLCAGNGIAIYNVTSRSQIIFTILRSLGCSRDQVAVLSALDSAIFYRIVNGTYLYLYDYRLNNIFYAYYTSFVSFHQDLKALIVSINSASDQNSNNSSQNDQNRSENMSASRQEQNFFATSSTNITSNSSPTPLAIDKTNQKTLPNAVPSQNNASNGNNTQSTKQSDAKQSDAKQSDAKQSDAKQTEAKINDTKEDYTKQPENKVTPTVPSSPLTIPPQTSQTIQAPVPPNNGQNQTVQRVQTTNQSTQSSLKVPDAPIKTTETTQTPSQIQNTQNQKATITPSAPTKAIPIVPSNPVATQPTPAVPDTPQQPPSPPQINTNTVSITVNNVSNIMTIPPSPSPVPTPTPATATPSSNISSVQNSNPPFPPLPIPTNPVQNIAISPPPSPPAKTVTSINDLQPITPKLLDGKWYISSIGNQKGSNLRNYYFIVNSSAKRFIMYGGCNVQFFIYTLNNAQISFGTPTGTAKTCTPNNDPTVADPIFKNSVYVQVNTSTMTFYDAQFNVNVVLVNTSPS